MNIQRWGKKIGISEKEYRELLMLFLESGSADIALLRKALESGNAQQVARCAHTLNGAAGNLGLDQIHEKAKRIESAANLNSLGTVSEDLFSLKKLFDEISETLEEGP